MDILNENIYNEFKHILSGCKNINDATYFANLYINKNPDSKKIVYNLLKGKQYYNCKDFKTLQYIVKECYACKYPDDVLKIITDHYVPLPDIIKSENTVQRVYHKNTNKDKDDIINNFDENVEINTLQRQKKSLQDIIKEFNDCNTSDDIIKKFRENFGESVEINTLQRIYLYKKTNYNTRKRYKYNEIIKKCPHCGNNYVGNNATNYVICGYHNNHQGYDWNGCQKDWCFSCEKILCKSWDSNKLYLEPNCIHDSECCKQYARKIGRSYEHDFCHCSNKFVRRGLRN